MTVQEFIEAFKGRLGRKTPRRGHQCQACGMKVPAGTRNALAAEAAVMDNRYICKRCEDTLGFDAVLTQWTHVASHL